MKAIILAGGKGTRLKEVISDIPKPMAPVHDRPFLEYLVLQLAGFGIRDIVISTGYRGDVVRAHFGTGERLGVNIAYSHEDEPLGTGGAIRKAAEAFDEDAFIAMNGDSFLNVSMNELTAFHSGANAVATLALAFVSDTARYGSVGLDADGRVYSFAEKGRSGAGYINGGVYVLSREAVREFPEGSSSIENDCMPIFTNRGLYGLRTQGFFIDIGVPADYLQLRDHPAGLIDGVNIRHRQDRNE